MYTPTLQRLSAFACTIGLLISVTSALPVTNNPSLEPKSINAKAVDPRAGFLDGIIAILSGLGGLVPVPTAAPTTILPPVSLPVNTGETGVNAGRDSDILPNTTIDIL
ncbi:hypothetical protein EYR41_009080 [Orbilia oligospora]|uniref:Uncharacterized protein n=1 Tax=Orbilia oligospora TaxID=2813651 RepID=A0A7C8KAG5_ORBOL|nr:hypothetical protein TWF751_007381 [Orbilia oligospora]TGJ65080.1 hypothetical protein EYR41_009080 [Orbilia oligospora]